MFGFRKPKMYCNLEGRCICRAKFCSSLFTDSKCYEKDIQSCLGLYETCSGDICNACVLLVKRWKKWPTGSKQTNKKLESRGRCKVKTLSGKNIRRNQISKLPKEFKHHNTDEAHSTTLSASPAQSPCWRNQSDDGSDTEIASGSNRTPFFLFLFFFFLDFTYWKRQKVCCVIIYKGCFLGNLGTSICCCGCFPKKTPPPKKKIQKFAAEKLEEQGPEPLPISELMSGD
uniref:Uncharacterized protein n=1 Tax=Catagonus wagneri TaxID=51154 RepID=A0A8C3WKS6_9CETA